MDHGFANEQQNHSHFGTRGPGGIGRPASGRVVVHGIVVLMSLFHAAHVLEHGLTADVAMTSLILATMLAPSLLAAIRLWAARKSAPVATETT